MKGSERVLKSMTIGEVLDYSIEVYKRNFKSIALIVIILYIPLVLLSSIISSMLQSQQLPNTIVRYWYLINHDYSSYNSMASNNHTFLTILQWLIYLVTFVHFIVLRPVMNAAIMKVVYNDVVTKKQQGLKTNLKECFKKMGSLVGNWVLYTLILAGMIVGFIIGGFILYFIIAFIIVLMIALKSMVVIIIGIVVISLIFIAAVLSIIIFYNYFKVRFSGTFFIIIENKSASQAFSRSLGLTKKDFWHISMSYIFGWLILAMFTTITTYLAYAGLLVNNLFFIIVEVFGQLINSVLATFLVTLLAIIFINMKIKKEGLDLEVKVDELLEQQKSSENGEPLNA